MGARVILADDEPKIRTVTGRLLRYLGHEVDAVEDGEALEQRADVDRYHLAIIDVDMPGPSAQSLIDTLRARGVRVVVSSGKLPREVEARYAADAYLPKPYALADLRDLLTRLLPEQAA